MASILNVDKIRATGSTTDGLTVDTSGRVLTPARPSFHVGKGNDYGFTSSDNDVKFDETTGTFHNSGMYDASNGRATAPVAGLYYFHCYLLTNNQNNNQDYRSWAFKKNGTRCYRIYHYQFTADKHMSMTGSLTIELAANDYISVEVINGEFYGGDSLYCQFMGHLVG